MDIFGSVVFQFDFVFCCIFLELQLILGSVISEFELIDALFFFLQLVFQSFMADWSNFMLFLASSDGCVESAR